MATRPGGLRRQFLRSEEGIVFLLGILFVMLWFGGILFLWSISHPRWHQVLTYGFTQLFGGRAACIAYGTQIGLAPALNVFFASFVDAYTVFVLYPLLVFGYRHVSERPFFQKHMQPVFESAQTSLPRVAKYKVAGVFAFVWFPFWMTGVVVGAVLGYLLGLKTWVNMAVVVLGTTSAALCWVLLYDRLYAWLGDIDPRIPMAVTVLVIVSLIVLQIRASRRRKAAKGESPDHPD